MLCYTMLCYEALPRGNSVQYGNKGEVVGPSPFDPEKKVAVLFLGNTHQIACYLPALCKSWPPPPLPGGYKVGTA